MSINQYSTDYHHHTLLWQQPNMDTTNNIPHAWFRFQNDAVDHKHQQQQQQDPPSETEALFEKHLTPSDVGKLNRLVIPKQHAERCFPLAGETPPPSPEFPAAEKGVLLCFEDVEDGKQWRFRYSYWNSSQSYVLTKGWSRYVKEKRLDAGDVVFFHRHRADGRRLFIGWRRRRGGGAAPAASRSMPSVAHETTSFSDQNNINALQNYHQSEYLHAGQVGENQTIQMTGNLRTVRLFGVNLECQPDDYRSEPVTPDRSSETGDNHQLYMYSNQPYHHPSYHTDMTFQMRNR